MRLLYINPIAVDVWDGDPIMCILNRHDRKRAYLEEFQAQSSLLGENTRLPDL